jgi:hypothetical protein
MNVERLVISENKSIFHNLGGKHSVYYVEGVIVKTSDDLQKGVTERKLVEKLSKKTGNRRYLDYDKALWLTK